VGAFAIILKKKRGKNNINNPFARLPRASESFQRREIDVEAYCTFS